MLICHLHIVFIEKSVSFAYFLIWVFVLLCYWVLSVLYIFRRLVLCWICSLQIFPQFIAYLSSSSTWTFTEENLLTLMKSNLSYFSFMDCVLVPDLRTLPKLRCQNLFFLFFLNVLCGGLVAKSCLTFATPWTVACQAPLSMGFSRQEYWSGLPILSPGDLPDPGIKPRSPALQTDSLLTELWFKSIVNFELIWGLTWV